MSRRCDCSGRMVLVLIGWSLVSGCQKQMANYDVLELASVKGRVLLDERPVADVEVVFEKMKNRFSAGYTNANGEYEVWYNSEQKGAMPGEMTVRFRPAPPADSRMDRGNRPTTGAGEGEDDEADPDSSLKSASNKVPDCYNRKSEIKVVIDPNGSHVFDFHLKSDCTTRGPQ